MVLKMSGIKLIVFDLDGTLVNSQYDLTDSVNFVRQKYGFSPLPVDKVASYLGSGITALVRAVLSELNTTGFDTAVKMFKDNYAKHLTDKTLPYKDVIEMLSNIPQQKVLLSNKDEKFSKQILKTLGLSKFFTEIYGGDSFKEKKPNPLPIYEIIKKFSLSKENVVMVGDGTNDIMVGKNAGIKTIGVLYGYSSQEQLNNLAPDYIAENPAEIVNIVKRLNS
ncbi:HAD family hydrolase [Candidatus Ruminimicrobium bovinum]|uniref:HAD family hydrolase n=1 Tax=Candidatus Ruminimicrobium bovinum TaxID=3242779 RepID=UPI0039B935EF